MDQHYRAFISYKHAPADIAVASEIQKRLERYHVPAAIRKKTGRDKIGRIFRDKEELPITSDLSDDISQALEDADFLIVICSTSTKLSTWVPREIDSFLKNHSKKQVLTVLVDGEPSEVIPERLLTDTAVRTAPDGTPYEEEVTYEPLSCDFRGGLKEARRSEIPRLAAALLGCKYDELVRREHQYKRRRNLAIGIPAACALLIAVSYLLWSRQEISKNYQRAEENYQLAQENYQLAQENYQKSEENYQLAQENYEEAQANLNKSLINQSSYLASESGKLLDNGDRLKAILLAMEALPDENAEDDSPQKNRPVTAVAQSALISALQAYVPEGTVDDHNAVTAIAEFAMEGSIRDYKGTDDGHYVVVRDSNGYVGVWDVATLSRVMMLKSEDIQDVRLLSDTQMVTLSDKGVASYDIPSGKELWRYNGDEDAYWPSGAIRLSREAGIVWAGEPLWGTNPDYSRAYSAKLLGIDATTGELLSERTLAENAEDSITVQQLACVSSGQWVAAAISSGYSSDGVPVQIFLLDTETDTCTELKRSREYSRVDTMLFVKDVESGDKIRLTVMAYPLEKYGQGGQYAMMNLYTEVQPMEIVVSCYDVVSTELQWINTYDSPQIQKIPYGKSLLYSDDSQKLVSLYANKAVVFDIRDGKISGEAETTSSIVTSGINVSDALVLYLDNGSIGVYHFDVPDRVIQMTYFDYDLRSATYIRRFGEETSDFLVVPEGKCVWLCRTVFDEAFVPYEGAPMTDDIVFKAECMLGDTITILDYDSHLYLYDLTEQTPGKVIDLPGEGYRYDLLGSDEAAGIVWAYDKGDPDQLIAVNTADGTMETYENKDKDFSYPQLHPDGTFTYWVYDSPWNRLMTATVKEGVLEESVLMNDKKVSPHYFVSPDLKTVVMVSSDKLQLVDLTEKVAVNLDGMLREDLEQAIWQGSGEGDDQSDTASEENLLAITDGYEAVILRSDGTEVARLSQEGAKVVTMGTYGDELIVLFGGGLLTRYRWADGTMISRSSVAHYESESFEEEVDWDFEEDTLYLIRRGSYRLMHVIDLETWEEEAAIQYGLGHDVARDRIVSFSTDDDKTKYVGYFPHYTVEDLRQKAKEALHGTELTQEEREIYGLRKN